MRKGTDDATGARADKARSSRDLSFGKQLESSKTFDVLWRRSYWTLPLAVILAALIAECLLWDDKAGFPAGRRGDHVPGL
jgi:hypothetical protein